MELRELLPFSFGSFLQEAQALTLERAKRVEERMKLAVQHADQWRQKARQLAATAAAPPRQQPTQKPAKPSVAAAAHHDDLDFLQVSWLGDGGEILVAND